MLKSAHTLGIGLMDVLAVQGRVIRVEGLGRKTLTGTVLLPSQECGTIISLGREGLNEELKIGKVSVWQLDGSLFTIREEEGLLGLLTSWQKGRVFSVDAVETQENGHVVVLGRWWDDPTYVWGTSLSLLLSQLEHGNVLEYREVHQRLAA